MEQILKSRYKIGQKISEGPFSVTYRGNFIGSEKPLIIKIYKRGTLNSSLINKMKQKVREFSALTHHGIARMVDGDYGWQGFYYVREFVEGQSLQEILNKRGKLSIEESCSLADQILAVLEEVHAKGIIHGALKPTNIFIDDHGLVKLTDFLIEGEIKGAIAQKVLEVMADAEYASPEEIEGFTPTELSDLYALGLILLTTSLGGTLPFSSGLAGNLNKIRAFPLSKEIAATLPRYFAEIISKALQPDPLLRFSSALEFRQSLEAKAILSSRGGNEELLRIFESSVTQYGGEEVDKESEAIQEVGRVRLHWGKEKHRNWILAIVIFCALILGILYAFFFGQ